MSSTLRVSRCERRGFTLTEIAIVLGIVGLILGAIWIAAAAVYQNLRLSHANAEVLQIAQGVRTLYATVNIIPGGVVQDITDAVVCAKAAPPELFNAPCGTAGGATLFDQWSGGATAIYVPASGDSFTIEMTNVPQSACIDLLMTVGGTGGRDPNLFAAEASAAGLGAAVPTAMPSALAGATSPVLADAAVLDNFGGCNAGGPNGFVGVDFGFALK